MSAPLLLLHGFALAPATFDALRAHLPPGRPVRAPFLPGHGDAPAARDFDDAVDRIAAEILPGVPVELVGYSLGARLALRLMLRHPERVTRATLIGARAGLPEGPEREARGRLEARFAATLRREGIAAFVEAWERLPAFAGQSDAQRETLRALRLAHDPEHLARALETLGLAAMPDTLPVLGQIHAPCLLLSGARDLPFRREAKTLTARLPCVRHVEIPACGHNLLLEQPAQVARLLRDHGQRPGPGQDPEARGEASGEAPL